ncbi:MAG: hypothetical protein GY820_22235, partial [Gammaproteobacteria bacterium]|nr:hypothetical protein [Gammaproteobacteria bacterium]
MTEREIELLNAHLLRLRAELQEQRSGFGMDPNDVPPVLMTNPPKAGESHLQYVGDRGSTGGDETHMQSVPPSPTVVEEAEVISQGEAPPSVPPPPNEGASTQSPLGRGSRRSSKSDRTTVVEGAIVQPAPDSSPSPDLAKLQQLGINSQETAPTSASSALFGALKHELSP